MPMDQFGLFDEPSSARDEVRVEPKITDEQVQKLREAFASAGISSMDERKAIIESCTVRPVATIREVYAHETPRILRRIEEHRNYTGPSTGCAWDTREEDTWIDRM
ncbi:hypothetical protein [Sinomonas sp. B1-1]|uniref:hypothetical protein n=1 Tax=Sinomonas sp. B1-1 TaxID=3141454 RepID=UPI003D2D30D6